MAERPGTQEERLVQTDPGVGDPSTKKFAFDVTGFIQSEGGRFIDRDFETGEAIAEDISGKRFAIDVNRLLESEKMNPEDVQVNWNSPSTALPDSPVDLLDRTFLAIGNVKGQVDFLSKRFDKVSVDEEKGIVVQDQGVWKQVDPDRMAGNRYAISEAIADTLEFAARETLPIAGSIAGFVGGTIGGFGVGGIPGAIGGQVAGAAARTAMGAYIGTYQPEEGEILADMAMETLYAAGGAVIPVAGRTAVNSLKATKNAFKTIGKKASEPIKETMAETYGALTGTGSAPVKVMMESTDDVVKAMRVASKKGGNTTEAIQDTITKDQTEMLGQMYESASRALPRKFGEALDDLFRAADKSTIPVGDVIDGVPISPRIAGTQRFGFSRTGTKFIPRKIEVDVGGVADTAIKDMVESGIVKVGPNGQLANLTPQEVGERLAQGLPVGEALNPGALKSMQKVFNDLSAMSGQGRMQGKAAARLMTGMNQRINSATRTAFRGKEADAALGRSLELVSGGFRKGMNGAFSGTALAKPWSKAVSLYDEYASAVATARRASDSPEALEAALGKLMTTPGKRVAFKGETKRLQELVGGDTIERLQVMEAAKKFAPMRIKMGMLGIAGAAGAAATAGPGALALGALAIPRVALKTTAAAKNLARQTSSATYKATAGVADLLKAMPKAGVPKLLQDELFWMNTTRMIGEAQQFEEQLSLQAQQGPVERQGGQ